MDKKVEMFDVKANAILAYLLVSMIPVSFFALLYKDPAQSVRDIIMVLVGAIVANATQAVQGRFGSSPGSLRKDATIAAMASTQAALAPAPPTDTIPVAPGETKTIQGTPDETT